MANSFLRSSVSVSICAMISALSYIIAFLQVIICPCLFTNHNLNSFRFWFCHDKSRPNKKENTSWISFKKCSLYSKYCIVFYPSNNSFCITILQNHMKNCCQFVVNSDLRCRNPLILLDFLVQRLHCGEFMILFTVFNCNHLNTSTTNNLLSFATLQITATIYLSLA